MHGRALNSGWTVRAGGRAVASWGLLCCAAVGGAAYTVHAPMAAASTLAGVLLLATVTWALPMLLPWQNLMIIALAGLIVLTYGFTNFALPGMAVPVPHLLAGSAFLLALTQRAGVMQRVLREPVFWCWVGMLLMTMLHLVDGFPRYGLYALRDSTMVIEGAFLALGYLWAQQPGAERGFLRVMKAILVVALLYTLTYPVGPLLKEISPTSGVFHRVSLLGAYDLSEYLVSAILLFTVVQAGEPAALRGFRVWVPVLLGVVGLLITQVRASYVAFAAALCFAMLVPGALRRRAVTLSSWVLVLALLIMVTLSAIGMGLHGRVGAVDASFFTSYVRSFVADDAPGAATRNWRLVQWEQVIDETSSSVETLLFGQGFGMALTNHVLPGEIVTRQPHNITLSVFGRLGLAGLALWLALLLRFFSRGYAYLRRWRHRAAEVRYRTVAWLVLTVVVLVVSASFGAVLEFSYGTIPFYVMMGLALGLMRGAPSGEPDGAVRDGRAPHAAGLRPEAGAGTGAFHDRRPPAA